MSLDKSTLSILWARVVPMGCIPSSNGTPEQAAISASPEVSIITFARIAFRPALLSRTTPLIVVPSITAETANEWKRSLAPAS